MLFGRSKNRRCQSRELQPSSMFLKQHCVREQREESIRRQPIPDQHHYFHRKRRRFFVDHLKSMASVGYGYTRSEVVNMASEYAVSLHKRDRDHPFSLKWFRNFMKRWPELNVTKPRSLSMARAKATNMETVTNYFEQLKGILTKYNLHDKPQHIYNVDEKGLQTEHNPSYVVGCKEVPTPAITSPRSSLTTVIGRGNTSLLCVSRTAHGAGVTSWLFSRSKWDGNWQWMV